MTPGWQQGTGKIKNRRRLLQSAFFILFLLAPPLNILRFDFYANHLVLFGQNIELGFTGFQYGFTPASEVIINLVFKAFLPLAAAGLLLLWTAWRWGRLYCGWLCPHFSMVEGLNHLMLRATGKPQLWESQTLPARQPDGSLLKPNPWYWILLVLIAAAMAFAWSVASITYVLPPDVIYYNLLHDQLSRPQFLFISILSLVLFLDFLFARHLFCRFGCSVGVIQSLAWMANRNAMTIGFNRSRARDCQECNNACDNVCPMRLKPRTLKRRMFTCTQCGECIEACTRVEAPRGRDSLLKWVEGDCAQHKITGREHGKDCF
ncbi:4Fe-4S binding protein [Thiolapillus brandeum]|uniref:4Fe-4S ferredoxin n=1 Tax=Thiolapillus brandeum TaxID=1076588 RepID=A0A7U6GJW9_9GAMM|nr:4Fe-4S binding protein [Thiolapillus brandeum]BAO45063.1 4Fe-4S ferredoxin [Thiolapillus brandeum]